MRRDTDLLVARACAIATAIAVSAGLSAGPVAAQELTIRVTPPIIRMTMFAGGSELRVEGRMAAGARAVVVIAGPEIDETLNLKRRVGPIWLNAGKVEVAGAPSLYLLLSPAPLRDLLRQDELARVHLDEAGIERRMRVRSAGADADTVRADYLSLKLDEGRYQFLVDAVRSEPDAAGGGATFAAGLQWPRTALPGTYGATVFECRDGAVARSATTTIEVVRAGLAATMRNAADGHAVVYGASAVLVMMVLGFGIDFLVARVRRLRARGAGRPPRTLARNDVAVH